MSSIGQNIKRIRIAKGLTQEKLGDLCEPKIAGSAIRRYENGGASPKLENLQRIAKALQVSSSELDPKLNEIMTFNNGEEFEQTRAALLCDIKISEMKQLMKKLNDGGRDKALEQVEMLTKVPEYRKESE